MPLYIADGPSVELYGNLSKFFPHRVTFTLSIPVIGRTFSGLGSPSPSCLGSQLACTLSGYPSTGVQVTGFPSAVNGAHSVSTILSEVQGFPFTASSSGEITAIASPVAFVHLPLFPLV